MARLPPCMLTSSPTSSLTLSLTSSLLVQADTDACPRSRQVSILNDLSTFEKFKVAESMEVRKPPFFQPLQTPILSTNPGSFLASLRPASP